MALDFDRWEKKVYVECCSDIEQSGIYGIGVRLLDRAGNLVTVIDVMVKEWREWATQERRRSEIKLLVAKVGS